MTEKKLRYGFTTGACAAAATLGAALMLRDQAPLESVELSLPAGFTARFALGGQVFEAGKARCFVVKDAGDDPDVTHGVEVHAELEWVAEAIWQPAIAVEGGEGVGRVTKPGLAVAVGEPAINPVPRQMILGAVASVFPELPAGRHLRVTISIPDGIERARRTLNERLGILGGLSILGTTGVVKPLSHKAWTDTLEVALDVALAAGEATVVLSTGRTSEAVAEIRLGLPEEALVMMGDHVGYALEACHRKGVDSVVLAAQYAKLVKIACGHPQTHVRSSSLDLSKMARWARNGGLDEGLAKGIECANTAREVFEKTGADHPLTRMVADRALAHLQSWAPGVTIAILLVGYGEQQAVPFGEWPDDLNRKRTP